jgi:hypothetical protein
MEILKIIGLAIFFVALFCLIAGGSQLLDNWYNDNFHR